MRKFIYSILLLVGTLLVGGCDNYDDGLLRENIDAIEGELSALEQQVKGLEEQMNAVSNLLKSKFVSYINQDAQGNYVISYIDANGETKTLTLAVESDIVKQPIIGVGEDSDGKLYWRTTSDNGATYQWLLDADNNKMPVGRTQPTISIDKSGYWTINGEQLLDADKKPVLANDVSNTLFKSVDFDEQSGVATFTLADDTSFTVQIYETLGITFEAAPVTAIVDRATPVRIKYAVSGSDAEQAFVDYFTAYNVSVSIDKYTQTIAITMDPNATEGNTVILVSAGGKTVLKPLFFTYGSAEIQNPAWDTLYGTGSEIQLPGEFTEFDVRVSANIEYEVSISEESQSWLKFAPATRGEMVTTTHKFVADYYENELGADRKGLLTFTNKPYGVTVTLGVRQSPVIPEGPSTPGIATGGDLVAFAKAVNAGGSTSRWQNDAGEVVLLNDIDLSGLTEWTPIGSGKASGTPAYGALVNPFEGVFNGQGYTIKGINWSFNAKNDASDLIGLFGAIKGATIKNLNFGAEGDKITITGSSENVVAVGAVVGYAEGATITKVTNRVSVQLDGDNPDAVLMMLSGIAGCAKATVIGGETKGDGVINYGNVKTGTISNTANGGTGMNVAGICAFTLGGGIKINYCVNYGNISAPTGRGGGLVGTLGGSTTETDGTAVSNSTNNGTIQDDEVGQYQGSRDHYNKKRMGGLVGGTVTNNNLRIEYCTNNGNVFSQLGCRTGGFVGHNQAAIVGCVNKGVILANITYDSGISQHGPGWACGYSAKNLIKQCAKGGKVGEWDTYKENPDSAPDATNDNALCYKNSEYFDPAQNY